MMTERDIDVAYVLEDIPGILGVYAVRDVAHIRYAVHIEEGGYPIAQTHYALLRVFTHEECATVAVYKQIPSVVRTNARRLLLSASAREDARRRVPRSTPALEQTLARAQVAPAGGYRAGSAAVPSPPIVQREARNVLIVDDDPAVMSAAVEAFGAYALRFVVGDPFEALWEVKAHELDAIFCDVDRAFGVRGFVSNLAMDDPKLAQKVILLMQPHGVPEPKVPYLEARRLRKPITAANLQQHPVVFPAPDVDAEPRRRRRVLLIDEEARPQKTKHITTTTARTAWEALEKIQKDWALVICSLSMKTDTGSRLYSVLWKARPDIKARFAFLVDHPDDSNRVLTRPLDPDDIWQMIQRLDDG